MEEGTVIVLFLGSHIEGGVYCATNLIPIKKKKESLQEETCISLIFLTNSHLENRATPGFLSFT